MPTTPPLDAEYGVCPIWPSKAAAEAVLRMAPREVPSASGSVAPDDPAGPAQARAVDEDPQRTQLRGGLDRGAHLLLVGDVGLDVHPPRRTTLPAATALRYTSSRAGDPSMASTPVRHARSTSAP
jgi:hypothetical protein